MFDRLGIQTAVAQTLNLPNIPALDGNFIVNMGMAYPGKLLEVVGAIYDAAKLSVYRVMQRDLFKLSDNYTGTDKRIYANRTLIKPTNIEVDAYETILPQIYQTAFGLQEGDIVEDILKDKDFFIKRGIQRFACKLDHSYYDYELKNFNG